MRNQLALFVLLLVPWVQWCDFEQSLEAHVHRLKRGLRYGVLSASPLKLRVLQAGNNEPKRRSPGSQEAVRLPETVSRKALAAGENTANNRRRLTPYRSQEPTYPDMLLADFPGFRQIIGIDIHTDSVAVGSGHGSVPDGDLIARGFPWKIVGQPFVFLMGSRVGAARGVDSRVEKSQAAAGDVRSGIEAFGRCHPGDAQRADQTAVVKNVRLKDADATVFNHPFETPLA